MAALKTLIAGNWKMNGLRADGVTLAKTVAAGAPGVVAKADLLLCPPATLLSLAANTLGEPLRNGLVSLGGQDCHSEASGAHTGDIAAPMLADLGCRYVIVGHSERRTNHREDDALVWQKAVAGQRAGLTAIICVGETEDERDRGAALDVVRRQINGSLPDAATAANTVIAYEPVWAIGTGRTPSLDDIAEVHDAMRALLAERLKDGDQVRLLYGGSVKPGNAAEILALANVNGALVGGASLNAADFLAIAAAA
ncbi:MAG: triose-phosphate isomerase [Alphaproteobacteria bacterium]|nr:triose-phosphate isomerase [Alphaproteobacteria bacterium]MCB9928167.1 triose-phosphate isomerase [Alphaproteobacteria bacterium]